MLQYKYYLDILILPLLFGCGQVCLTYNKISGLFDQQYNWEKSIDIFVCYVWS